jgi:transglutaminase-like putative cysteine protease
MRVFAAMVILLTLGSTLKAASVPCRPAWPRPNHAFLTPFLQAEPPFVPSDTDWARNLATSLSQGATTDRLAARRIYDFVRLTIAYDPTRPPDGFPWLPRQTLTRKKGSCVDDTLLYMTLCRSVGIPTRFASGIGRYRNHDWAQVYLTGEGWIHVDPERGRRQDQFGRLYPDLVGHWWPDKQDSAPVELALGRAYAGHGR